MTIHISCETERQKELERLKLRKPVKELLLGKLDAGPFNEYFEAPSYFYAQGWPNTPANWPEFNDRVLLPLWEYSGQVFALDIKSGINESLSFFIECPDQPDFYSCINEMIFKFIRDHVWEFGGAKEEADESIQFAKLIELPKVSELDYIFSEDDNASQDDIEQYILDIFEKP